MAVKYLDNAGTQYLVNKIKAIDGKIPTESQITTMITTALNTYKEGIVTIVESLPQTGEEGKLYLMVDPSDSDVYIIYTWEENAFKRMGSKTFTLTVDSALSSTSTNPVQNKVVKSALDGKANSSHTHGSITNDGKLGTASRVVITGTDKKIGISSVTTTELGYLSGVTSAIQTQLNSKSATGHTHTAGDVAGLATVATSGSYNDLSNKPSIPTKTSDLTNDSNFVDTSNSAVASGITSAKVTSYDSHIADTDIHVTTADKNRWNNNTYVFRYSSTALVASSTNSNTLLDNTDNLKVGDKVIDSNGVLFSITAIDTANSTFTVGSALVDLAKDSDVVHTSGNETVGGVKTFSDNTYITSLNFTNEVESQSSSSSAVFPIVTTVTYTDSSPSQSARLNFRITANGDKSFYPHENNQYSFGVASRRWTTLYGYLANLGGTYVGNEASANERTNLYLLANRDTDGQSGAYIGRFRQNRAQGAMSGGDVSFVSLDFLENSTRYTRCFTMGLTDWDSDGVPQTYYITAPNGKGTLGTSYQQWNKVYANEYYYGSNNVEFSNKFCTLDTDQTVTSIKSFMGLRTEFKRSNNDGVLLFSNGTFSKGDTPLDVTQISRKYYGDATSVSSSIGYSSFSIQNNGNKTVYQLYSVANTAGSSSRTVFTLNYDKSLSGTDAQYATFGGNVLPDVTGTYNLGNSTSKWATINGLNPSSLSMPDLSNGIDISSYITVVANANKESLYTPPANGWVCVRLSRTSGALGVLLIQGGLAISGKNIEVESGVTTADATIPVIGGVQVSINSALADGVVSAYFYPCQGNV